MSQGDNFQSVNSESIILSSSTDMGCVELATERKKIQRGWTRDNPGRRFLGCRGRRVGNKYDQISKQISTEFLEKLEKNKEECEALKRKMLVLSERSLVLRNVLVASSVGFVVVLGGIIGFYANV
ncbi:hypothetical protein Bca4012_058326 [Brassica carinata]